MTGVLVKLKLTLLRNGLQRSVWQIVGLAFAGLYGLSVISLGVAGLVALRFTASAEIADIVTVIGFTLVTIGWVVIPMFAFGVDNTVDPSRFALYGVRARDLLPGLWIAGLLGIPGIATVLISLALVLTWSIGVLTAIAALVTAVVGAALCVLWSRTVLTWLAVILRGRRARDFAIIALMILIFGGSLALQGVSRIGEVSVEAVLEVGTSAATVLGWTPPGWIWGLPGAVAGGHWFEAGIRIVLSAALTFGLLQAWRIRLDRELTSPIDGGEQAGSVRASSWVDRLVPATPAGAIASRGFRYWRRDPRYQIGLVALVVLPIFLVVVALLNDQGLGLAAWAPVLIAGVGGISVASDTAYDNSAFGLHLLAGVSGRDDRWGRAMTYLWILTPLVLLAWIVAAVFTGTWDRMPAMLGLSSVLLVGGLGVGLAVGAHFPGRVAAPGTSPFASRSGSNLESLIQTFLVMLLTAAISLPTLVLVVLSYLGPIWWGWIAVPVGLVCGLAALRIGLRIGGERIDRAGPELLATLTT